MDKYEVYCNLSRAFAKQQLIERFCFEMSVSKLLFDEDVDFNSLLEDTHSSFLFTCDEYKRAYDESKEILRKIM